MSTKIALLIQTKDNRKYFTYPHNIGCLGNFIKTFEAEVSLVEVTGVKLLDLPTLAKSLCDESYRSPDVSFVKSVNKLNVNKGVSKTRSDLVQNAQKIRHYIRTTLESGKTLSASTLYKKFSNLSASCLSNHITAVCQEMRKTGIKVERLRPGLYKIV
jgi:hypothetical protein